MDQPALLINQYKLCLVEVIKQYPNTTSSYLEYSAYDKFLIEFTKNHMDMPNEQILIESAIAWDEQQKILADVKNRLAESIEAIKKVAAKYEESWADESLVIKPTENLLKGEKNELLESKG